jgi:hypothetical protein
MFMQWVLYHSAAPFGETPDEFQKKLQSNPYMSSCQQWIACCKNVAILVAFTFDEIAVNTLK